MIWSSAAARMRRIAAFSRLRTVITDLKPRVWIVISGVIATIDTTPKAKSRTADSLCSEQQAPITSGRMKLDVSGPLATPPESNAIAVYSRGTKKDSPRDSR